MAMEAGQSYSCSTCGCRIEVTKSSRSDSDDNPRCCCGSEMSLDAGKARRIA
jgi:hypothetical protein